MGSFIVRLFVYFGTIFIFFLFLGFLPDLSPHSVDVINSSYSSSVSPYESYNRVETFSKMKENGENIENEEYQDKNKIDSTAFIKRFKFPKKKEGSEKKSLSQIESKEEFLRYIKINYKDKIDSVKISENGYVVEFEGKLFDSDKSIYIFHKKIDEKLRELGFKEARYLWYGSNGDYTIFNLTR